MSTANATPPPVQQTARRCDQCNGLPETKLKYCKGCLLVKYCSAACQALHWPAHKRVCASIAAANAKAAQWAPGAAEDGQRITRWVDCWRETLLAHGMHAMDVANHGAGWLAENILVLELDIRADAPESRRLLRLVCGGVVPRARFMRFLRTRREVAPGADHTPENQGPQRLRAVLLCGDHFRVQWMLVPDLERWRAEDRQMSRRRTRRWERVLRERLDAGQPL